jgi:SSS family solute:Na+ symporter
MDIPLSLDNLIVILYMLTLFVLAIVSARRIHSMEDYAVSSRTYPAWVIYATICATLVGGGFTIGNAEMVHQHGLVFILALCAISVRELCIAFYIAPHMGRFTSAISVGDIMKEAYGMPAKIITGFFAGILCAGLIGIQLRAIGTIFEVFFGLDPTIGILLGCGLVIFYVTLGGFKAVVWTDVLQFLILIIALPLAAILAVIAAGGPAEMISALPPDRLDLFAHFSPLAYFSIIAYFLFGEALSPPYLQRLLAGNAKQVTRAALWAGLTALPLGLVIATMALATLVLNPQSQPHEVIPYIVSTVLPVGIAGFVMAAMLAVIMSSADSYLNASAVNLVHDVSKPLLNKNLSNRQELWLTQGLTLILGGVSIIFALSFENLFDSILMIYGLWSPVVLIPIIAAIRGYKGNTTLFLILAASGFITSVTWDHVLATDSQISGVFIGPCVAAFVFIFLRRFFEKVEK